MNTGCPRGAIDRLVGTFTGSGSWHDSAGKAQAYKVAQAIGKTADGFEISFRHDFEDASVTEARFLMRWTTPVIFDVLVADRMVGNGYCFNLYCHYHLALGDRFVQASYSLEGARMKVYGSSTRNAEGRYIAWSEDLTRTMDDE
jgi:hypothetical protein